MKRYAFAFMGGAFSMLLLAAYAGPDAIIQVGLRYAAARTHYVYDAHALEALDLAGVDEILAEAPKPSKRGR